MFPNWYTELNLFGLVTFPLVSVRETMLETMQSDNSPLSNMISETIFETILEPSRAPEKLRL